VLLLPELGLAAVRVAAAFWLPLKSLDSLSKLLRKLTPRCEVLVEAACAVFVQQPQVGEDVHKLEGLPHLELAHAAAVMESTKPQLHSHTPAELTWFSKRTAMRCSPGACHQSAATTGELAASLQLLLLTCRRLHPELACRPMTCTLMWVA